VEIVIYLRKICFGENQMEMLLGTRLGWR